MNDPNAALHNRQHYSMHPISSSYSLRQETKVMGLSRLKQVLKRIGKGKESDGENQG